MYILKRLLCGGAAVSCGDVHPVSIVIILCKSPFRFRVSLSFVPLSLSEPVHLVSITRFPLRIFSPDAGLLRYVLFIGSG